MDVTVIIPVFNAKRWLSEAVASALSQPETVEVILVEDGSTDGSLAECYCLQQANERVRVLRHPHGANRGAGESRSAGVWIARSEYVAFLDADDIFLPRRFDVAASIFACSPEVDGVYDAIGTLLEDDQMRRWGDQDASAIYTMREGVSAESLFEALVTGTCGYFHTIGLTVRKRIFERTGPFDAPLRMCQDSAMWIKMAAVGQLVGGSIHEPVAMRRWHGENRIFTQRSKVGMYQGMMWRILLDWGKIKKLSQDRMQLLLTAMIHQWYRHNLDEPQVAGVRRRVREVGFLSRILARHPWAAFNAAFRRRCFGLFLTQRMERVFQQKAALGRD